MPGEDTPTWDYSGLYGEESWADNFVIGLRQSPINIRPSEANLNTKLTPLTFTTTKTRCMIWLFEYPPDPPSHPFYKNFK